MIPGWLISILTFPGIVVHEMAHRFFCDLFGVKVLKVCYFRFGNPAGYVLHEKPDNAYQHIIIGIGPFLFNSVVGALIAAPGMMPLLQSGHATPVGCALIWLGISIAMHAFPSTGDARSIWSALWSERAPALARLVGTPLIVVIYIGAVGSAFWLDLAYGVAVAWALPKLIISLMA